MDDELLAANLCLRDAWPSSEREEVSGWLLRATGGGYDRANSVWPGAFSGDISINTAIDRAEAFYRRRNLRPRFQMLRSAMPEGLDSALAARGYRREIDCSILAKPVGTVAMPRDVMFANVPTPDWLEMYTDSLVPAKAAECRYILVRVPVSRAFLLVRDDGKAVSLALVVRRGADVAVDCVLTHPDHRRAGAATKIMLAAEAWAAGQAARRLVLSVVADNLPAVALYGRLGFTPLSAYHYRTLDRG